MSLILPFPFDSAAEDRRMGCKFVLWMALNLTNFFFDHLDPTILKMHPTSKNNEKWVHFIIMKSKPGPRAFIILNKISALRIYIKITLAIYFLLTFFRLFSVLSNSFWETLWFFLLFIWCVCFCKNTNLRERFILFLVVCMSVYPCEYEYINTWMQVSLKDRWGHFNLWRWSYRCLWATLRMCW